MDGEYNSIGRYPMRSKPRGMVLLITNIYYNSPEEKPRISAKHDEDNLNKLFTEIGFQVVSYQNLTGEVSHKLYILFLQYTYLIKLIYFYLKSHYI